jgi:phage terminase small subunit
MKNELTQKQRLFVEAFIGPANGNAREAARAAIRAMTTPYRNAVLN